MKLRLNFQIFVSHVILSKNLLNETKKMTQHRKDGKVTGNMPQSYSQF